jgi:hypothetical protein
MLLGIENLSSSVRAVLIWRQSGKKYLEIMLELTVNEELLSE